MSHVYMHMELFWDKRSWRSTINNLLKLNHLEAYDDSIHRLLWPSLQRKLKKAILACRGSKKGALMWPGGQVGASSETWNGTRVAAGFGCWMILLIFCAGHGGGSGTHTSVRARLGCNYSRSERASVLPPPPHIVSSPAAARASVSGLYGVLNSTARSNAECIN